MVLIYIQKRRLKLYSCDYPLHCFDGYQERNSSPSLISALPSPLLCSPGPDPSSKTGFNFLKRPLLGSDYILCREAYLHIHKKSNWIKVNMCLPQINLLHVIPLFGPIPKRPNDSSNDKTPMQWNSTMTSTHIKSFFTTDWWMCPFIIAVPVVFISRFQMLCSGQCLFPSCCSYLIQCVESCAVPYLIKCDINTFDEMK